ncbi:MAG: PAS domain-containing protein [Parafilimonas sp.]|nr:PAS domain-containing protein [Parafilimonas sp.]
MIVENSISSPASFNIYHTLDFQNDLNFSYLNGFAKFLLENLLDDFVEKQLIFSREIKLPLLKYFENFSDEELIAIGKETTQELLKSCAENKAHEYIKKSVDDFLNNQMVFITKGQIISEDIILLSFMRRKLFRHFITAYTTDTDIILKTLHEADVFTSVLDAVCLKAFVQTQRDLFSHAQSLAHIGNWEWDLKTKVLFWSDEVYRIYELDPQTSIPSQQISIYNHPDDAEMVSQQMQTSMQTLQPHDFFYRIILKDGRQKTLHAKGQVKLNKKGIPTEMFGTLQDITEQKQREKELEESKKFAEKIADVSPCIITAYNVKKGQYIFLNKGLQTLLGYDIQEFYEGGRNLFYELVHRDDVTSLAEKINSIVREANKQAKGDTEQITELKYRLKHKNGSYKWIQTFTTVFNRDENNLVQDMLNVSIDITESYNLSMEVAAMNDRVRKNELQHQRMINEVEDYAILMMDKEGIIKNWNKGAEKIKGYLANEIIGKSFKIFYRKEDQESKLPESLIAHAAKVGKASHEGWRVRKDGSTFWGSVVISAIHDDDNNLIGFTKVTRNLTEKKLAEDRLRDYAHRIEKHNEELQRINKDLDSFTYMASHDLQEPLRKIRTFCNIIQSKSSESLSADISVYFERIVNSVTRMQTLIDSLLNYSRATSKEINLRPVKLNSIIEEVKKDFSEIIEEKHVKILYTDLPVIKAEPLQMGQLFSNLIENAIKYKREDVPPEIKINFTTVYKKDEDDNDRKFYRVTVSDNGIGFEQKYAENVFKLFQRLHGRNEYSGTGIGLAICKKIVENHKGTITATSEPGNGSVFIIELPAELKEEI